MHFLFFFFCFYRQLNVNFKGLKKMSCVPHMLKLTGEENKSRVHKVFFCRERIVYTLENMTDW